MSTRLASRRWTGCLCGALCALAFLMASTGRAQDKDSPPAAQTRDGQDVTSRGQKAARGRPTPLVPRPHDPRRPAFQLYAEFDLPALGLGLVFASSRLLRDQPSYCAPLCDDSELNRLDRSTAGFWSLGWQRTSDISLAAILVGAGTLLLVDEGFVNGLNDSVVVAEAALASVATASIMTLAVSRPRPYLYGEEAPLDDRNSSKASLSFLSSHAAVAFATVTSTLIAMRRLHPTGVLPWIVAGVGGAAASLVAISRILGGKHFISDALGGAVIGTSLGVLIPALHHAPVQLSPTASPNHAALSLVGRF